MSDLVLLHPWQIYDATTQELVSQMSLLSQDTGHERNCKLLSLIQKELAERGNCDMMLHRMTQLHDATAILPAEMQNSSESDTNSLSHAHTVIAEASDQAAQAAQGSDSLSVPIAERGSVCPAGDQNPAQLLCVALSSTAVTSANVVSSPSTADSVLAAAMQAYKQEKQQLWKARKAGSKAGWGFAKYGAATVRPDSTATAVLGPLRNPGRPATYHPKATNGHFYAGQQSGSHSGVARMQQATVHMIASLADPCGSQAKVEDRWLDVADSTCADPLPPSAACATSKEVSNNHQSERGSCATHSSFETESNAEETRQLQHARPSSSSCLESAGQNAPVEEMQEGNLSQSSLQVDTDSAVQHTLQQICGKSPQDSIHCTQDSMQPVGHSQESDLQHGLETPPVACIETASNDLLLDETLPQNAAKADPQDRQGSYAEAQGQQVTNQVNAGTESDPVACSSEVCATSWQHHSAGSSSSSSSSMQESLHSSDQQLNEQCEIHVSLHDRSTQHRSAEAQDGFDEQRCLDLHMRQSQDDPLQAEHPSMCQVSDLKQNAGYGWYPGRALSEASSSASDDKEGTPTPSGRDSILELQSPVPQQQWPLEMVNETGEAQSLVSHTSSHTSGSDDNAAYDGLTAEASGSGDVSSTWICPSQRLQRRATKQQPTALLSRLEHPDWNIQTDDGLCSWPSTPLHDAAYAEVHQSSPVRISKQDQRSKIAMTGPLAARHLKGLALKSLHNSTEDYGQVFKWGQGERLVLGNS